MRQVDLYKEALRQIRGAEHLGPIGFYDAWRSESGDFKGLCTLISNIAWRSWGPRHPERDSSSVRALELQFRLDSEKLLGHELDTDKFWFTNMLTDEPKARKERVEHLKNLIKLYEDGK